MKHKAQQAGSEEQVKSLEERKKEFEEVMEQARQLPSEPEIMKMSLAIAANSSEDETMRVQALQMVQELAENIDLANGASAQYPRYASSFCIWEGKQRIHRKASPQRLGKYLTQL